VEHPRGAARRRASPPPRLSDDPPRYTVEEVRIRGRRRTHPSVIRRKVGIKKGDVITPDDPRIVKARMELLASGLFRDVSFSLSRGSKPGRVILNVRVRERGTIVVQALHLGFSNATPFWGGLDLAENNFLGRGLHLSGAFVVGAAAKDVAAGARIQHAEQLRFSYPGLIARRVGMSLMLTHVEASELMRIAGWDPNGTDVENFSAVRYTRVGGVLGLFGALGSRNMVYLDYRLEWINARLPDAVRIFPGGRSERLSFDLIDGYSYLSSLAVTFVRDTRNDPVLPTSGMRLELAAELATKYVGSGYQFAKVVASFQKHWQLPWYHHVISLHLYAGVIIGRTPLFNKFFIGDLNEQVPQRALGLNFATRPSRNLFSNSIAEMRYETIAGRAAVRYSIPLSRGGRLVYSSNFYVSLGLITMLSEEDFRVRDEGLRRAIPIDMVFDVGFRLDTYVGVFTLSFGNALGWIPR
jgi:outer membrane protein insertion porin family